MLALGTIAESATELSDEEHEHHDYHGETAGGSAFPSPRTSGREGAKSGEGVHRDSYDGTLTPRSELELRDRVGAWLASGISSLSSLGVKPNPSYPSYSHLPLPTPSYLFLPLPIVIS